MKHTIKHQLKALLLFTAISCLFVACEKDSDGSPDVKAGNMSSGAIDPGSAAGGVVVTLKGAGIGQIRSIVFEKNNVPAPFLSTLNTETDLVFRVPDTAYGGPQNVIFTNADGKTLSVPFAVIALPSVTSAFPTDFEAGSNVSLEGNNLDDVTSVVIDGTTTAVTIVSKTRKKMVVTMPASTSNRVKLKLTNASGVRVTDQEFVNVDVATKIFTQDFDGPAQSWSWGGTFASSTDVFVTGGKSLKAAYDPTGSWGGLQIGMGSELPLPAGTKYFSYWIKGADVDKNVKLEIKGNNWSLTAPAKTITVPANKWTYYREEVSSLIPNMNSISVILFQIHDDGKTLYFDNIMFSKQ